MVRDLNQMLREKLQGGNPDFQGFMDKHGQFFPPGIESLEELMEHLQRQAAQMQSLLNSMTPEMRQEPPADDGRAAEGRPARSGT